MQPDAEPGTLDERFDDHDLHDEPVFMDREALTPILRKTTRLPAEDAVHVCRAASQMPFFFCFTHFTYVNKFLFVVQV